MFNGFYGRRVKVDDQANTGAAAGTVETRPSFVSDVIHGAERVAEGIGDDIEDAAESVLVAGERVLGGALAITKGTAHDMIETLGRAHVLISSIGDTAVAEVHAARTSIEAAIIGLARHIGGDV
jgi:hypothetical protein